MRLVWLKKIDRFKKKGNENDYFDQTATTFDAFLKAVFSLNKNMTFLKFPKKILKLEMCVVFYSYTITVSLCTK